jgi:polysaccharide transporter, PST family
MFQKINLVQNLSPNLRKVLSNMSWLFAERILRMGVGFFIVAWMARYLGKTQFGLLNYASAFLVIFNTIATLGLNQIVIRDFVNEPEKRYEIAGTSFFLRLIGGICGFVLAIFAIFHLRADDLTSRNTVVIIAASMLLLEFQGIDDWFHSQVRSKYVVWATNTAFAVMTIVKIALIQLNASVIAFAWAILVESALSCILLVIVYQGTRQKMQKWRFNWLRAQNLLRIGWPLIFSELAIMVYVKIDQVMLGEMAGDAEVGIYSVAVRIAESWLFFLATIVTSIRPSIIAAKKFGEEAYYQKIKQSCSFLTGIVYIVAFPMMFLSTPIIVLIFGKDYTDAGIILAVYFWSSLFTAGALIKDIWITVEEHTTYALVTSIAGALTNILLNLYLIPKYGALGSAIATVISYILTDYVSCFFYKPAHKLGWIMTRSFVLEGVFKGLGIREESRK